MGWLGYFYHHEVNDFQFSSSYLRLDYKTQCLSEILIAAEDQLL